MYVGRINFCSDYNPQIIYDPDNYVFKRPIDTDEVDAACIFLNRMNERDNACSWGYPRQPSIKMFAMQCYSLIWIKSSDITGIDGIVNDFIRMLQKDRTYFIYWELTAAEVQNGLNKPSLYTIRSRN